MSFLTHVLEVPFIDAVIWTGLYAALGFVVGFTVRAINWPPNGHPLETNDALDLTPARSLPAGYKGADLVDR